MYDTQPARELTEKIIRHEYSDVFQGLGCIGTDYKIEVDDVKPVIATTRRWSISKVDVIKEKLFKMEQAKIIKPWVSNMVAVTEEQLPYFFVDALNGFKQIPLDE